MQIQKISREELFSLEGKFIFHGSTKIFEEAKPHQAQCDSKNPKNEQLAVYGSNNIVFALLFAFEKLPRDSFSWEARFVNGKYIGILKDGTYIDDEAKGYIYCFDKTNFVVTEKGSSQYVCKQNIKPLQIYEVKYKDFADLFINVITNKIEI